jgi:hypothetical protein
MYAGAVVSTVNLIILLAFIGYIRAYRAMLGHRLTAAQVSQLNTSFITLAVVSDLVPIALWLWMARENGQGRNWARSLSTVLFGLATLDLTGAFRTPVIRITVVPMLFGPTVPVLTWLAGLAAVWLLWRPASTAFFKPEGFTQAGHGVRSPSRIRSSSSRQPRHL